MTMILAILQARVSSTRLAGKVLKPLQGKPMLQHQIERVLRSRRIDRLVVATSADRSDDGLEALCGAISLPCHRGDLDDVLDRTYQAALPFNPQHIVRLTGDCPLLDPAVVDRVIEFYLEGNYDYATNSLEETFPDGLDVEVFSFSALRRAWATARLPSEREHVTPFIRNHPELFRIGSLRNDRDLSVHRWTVDEPRDFDFVSLIYRELYPGKHDFATADILAYLERNPEAMAINRGIGRNEGYAKSLAEDRRATAVRSRNIEKSFAMQQHAKERIPGLSQLLSKRPDLFSYGLWPGYFSAARGAEVWDLDGNRYVDMSIGGVGANVLGYADPDVDSAVKEAIDRGTSCSLNCPEEVELADLLCELHPWARKVRFARTGGESMSVAVRIARACTGRDKVAFCGYHGWHDWYLAANLGTQNALGEHLISGLDPAGVPLGLAGTSLPFRYNRSDELAAILCDNPGEIAAVVMEPIRNQQPEPGFFATVRKLAQEHGAVLIVDEISAGFRLNSGGAHLSLGLEPDVAVFSKALGNGYPIAAVIGKAEVMDAAQKTFISSTAWTERVGPVAAIATIRKHRRCNVADHLVRIGQLVQECWRAASQTHGLPISLGGIPPLGSFAFTGDNALLLKTLFIQGMLERGFLATTGFYAMYAHREAHVRAYAAAADAAFGSIRAALETGRPEECLRGEQAVAGFKRLN